MHVGGWEFEGVFEAVVFDGAFFADGSGLLYVGDVLVFFGEHQVGASFTVGVVHPFESGYKQSF